MDSLTAADHLAAGFIRTNGEALNLKLHDDVIGMVLHYIDVENTNYYPPPINSEPFNPFIQLQEFGIDAKQIESGNLIIGSIEYCVLKELEQVRIINIPNKTVKKTLQINADSISFNATENVIAIVTNKELQIYDINNDELFQPAISEQQFIEQPSCNTHDIQHCQWLNELVLSCSSKLGVQFYSYDTVKGDLIQIRALSTECMEGNCVFNCVYKMIFSNIQPQTM